MDIVLSFVGLVVVICIHLTETFGEIHQQDKLVGDKAVFHCNTVDVKSTLWERVGSNSDILFIGLRSSGYDDLDNVVISADNYSITISPIAVADEGLYTCSHKSVMLEIYNLSVKDIHLICTV